MPQARDEAGNIWEVDAQGNAIRLISSAQSVQTKPVDQKLPAELQKLTNQAQASEYDPAIARLDVENKKTQNEIAKQEADRKAQEAEATNYGTITPKIRQDAISDYLRAQDVKRTADRLVELYKSGPGATSGISGLLDYLPLERNQVFNTVGNTLRGGVKATQGFTGGEGNTAAESALNIGPFIPNASDRDAAIEEKINELYNQYNTVVNRTSSLLGGLPDQYGNIVPQEKLPLVQDNPLSQNKSADKSTPLSRNKSADKSTPLSQIPSGDQKFFNPSGQNKIGTGNYTTDKDKAIHTQLQTMFERGASAAELKQAVTDSGYPYIMDRVQDVVDYRDGTGRYAKQGPRGGAGFEIPTTGERGQTQELINKALLSPQGTLVASTVSGLGFGALEGFNPEAFAQLRETNPNAALGGDILGAIGGVGAISVLGRAAAKRAAPSLLGGGAKAAAGRNLAADATYGGLYSQNTGGDPLTGAMLAGGGSILGRGLGKVVSPAGSFVANSKPVLSTINAGRQAFGKRSLPYVPKLSPEDSTILSAIDDFGLVNSKIADAQRFGVPITLADASEELTSLAGAAVRRSPLARGFAKSKFEERQAGQIDRLLGAVDRDLGPINNIPELSDSLIKKARQDSSALYDKAFSNPGAGVVDLDKFKGRPAFKDALKNAYNTAKNRGDSGDTINISFDAAGDPLIGKTPNFRTLNDIKLGIDDVIEKYREPITGKYNFDSSGFEVNKMLRDYIAEVDRINPDYAAARSAYSGPASEMSALLSGQKAYLMSPDELKSNFSKLNNNRKEQFRLGDISRISDQANKVRYSSNPYESIVGSPASQERMKILHPSGADNFIQQYKLEKQLADSNRAIFGGSPTALNMNADQAFSNAAMDNAAGIASDIMLGAPINTAKSMANRGIRFLADSKKIGVGKKRAEQLSPILFDDFAANYLKKLPAKKRKASMLGRKSRKISSDISQNIGFGISYPLIAATYE